jgi:hypothetical protein
MECKVHSAEPQWARADRVAWQIAELDILQSGREFVPARHTADTELQAIGDVDVLRISSSVGWFEESP